MPDVLRVQRPRLLRVVRPLDNRPAIRAHRELVVRPHLPQLELQEEPVEIHLAGYFELPRQVLEAQPAGDAVRHLDRVPPAQAGRLRPVLALEPLELPLLAARAVAGLQQARDLDPPARVEPQVEGHQLAVDRVLPAREEFQRLGGLVTRHDRYRRPEYPGRLARADLTGPRGGLEHALQARGLARDDGHRLALTPDGPAEYPRLAELHRRVVDRVPDLEVVRPVHDHVRVPAQVDDVRPVDVGNHRLDCDRGVD